MTESYFGAPVETEPASPVDAIASRAKRAAAQARLWDIREGIEREWDGADAGIEADLEALRIAADVLQAFDREPEQ